MIVVEVHDVDDELMDGRSDDRDDTDVFVEVDDAASSCRSGYGCCRLVWDWWVDTVAIGYVCGCQDILKTFLQLFFQM